MRSSLGALGRGCGKVVAMRTVTSELTDFEWNLTIEPIAPGSVTSTLTGVQVCRYQRSQ